MKNKTKIFLIILLFFNALSYQSRSQCSIPNGNFNSWMDLNLTDWLAFSVNQIPGRTGPGFAARLITSQGIPVPAIMSTGFPCNTRSNFLNGFVRSNFQNSPQDTLILQVYFKLQGSQSPAAIGICYLNQTISNWTPFHVAISNVTAGPVDSAYFNILKIGTGSSTVDFDDFSFGNTSTGQTLGNCETITSSKPLSFSPSADIRVFPNPAKTELKIAGLSKEQPLNFEIKNMTGQLVAHGTDYQWNDPEPIIPLHNIRPGMYFLKVKSGSGLWMKKIQIQ